jgi:hypothetical protein
MFRLSHRIQRCCRLIGVLIWTLACVNQVSEQKRKYLLLCVYLTTLSVTQNYTGSCYWYGCGRKTDLIEDTVSALGLEVMKTTTENPWQDSRCAGRHSNLDLRNMSHKFYRLSWTARFADATTSIRIRGPAIRITFIFETQK